MRIPPAITMAALLAANATAQDTTPPAVSSISLSPPSVDVSAGTATLHVTIQITDDVSGFQDGFVNLHDPSDNNANWFYFDSNELTAGDDMNGTYDFDITVPMYVQPGSWNARVDLWDNAGNYAEFGGSGDPFPVPADALFSVTNTGPVDSSPSQATSISVSPPSVDVSSVAQQITVAISITDDLSGFRYGNLYLVSPSDETIYDLTEYFSDFSRVSGSDTDGTYEVTLTIPAGSEEGTWSVEWFLRDEAGNTEFSPASALPGSSFEVSSGSGASLGELPDATDATHLTWSTTGDMDWFTQNTTTWDGVDAAQSGAIGDNMSTEMSVDVTGPGTLDFWWKVDSETDWDELTVTGPDGFEDTISGFVDWEQVSIPIPSGTHTVTWTYTKDGGAAVGADAGWVDRVTFTSEFSDNQPPVLQRIDISPGIVDLSAPDTDIIITLELSDDWNGISGGTVYLYDEYENYITDIYYSTADLVDGDPLFGTYEIHYTIEPYDFDPFEGYLSPGICRVEVEVEEDYGITRTYSPYDDPFPIPGAELFTVSEDGSGNGGDAPFLTSVDQISPTPVVIDGSDETVTFEFTAGGGSSPLDNGSISLYNGDGGFVTVQGFTDFHLVSGDSYDGSYSVDVTIPALAPPGTWFAVFRVSNSNGDDVYYPFDEDFPNPGEEEFEVQNIGTFDSTPPALTSFSLAPSTVDTSVSPQSIDVTLTATDDMAGITGISIWVHDPNYDYQSAVSQHISPPSPTLGDTFTTTIEVPAGSMEGDWICEVYLRDDVGNSVTYGDSTGPAFPVAGSNIFTVGTSPSSTFGNFATTYGLTGQDALPSGNPDGDWLANGFELLIGSNPTVNDTPDPAKFLTERSAGQLRIVFTIDPGLSVQTNGDFLEVSDGSTPVRVSGQSGSGLSGPWNFVAPVQVSGSTYEITTPIVPGQNGFLRTYMDTE